VGELDASHGRALVMRTLGWCTPWPLHTCSTCTDCGRSSIMFTVRLLCFARLSPLLRRSAASFTIDRLSPWRTSVGTDALVLSNRHGYNFHMYWTTRLYVAMTTHCTASDSEVTTLSTHRWRSRKTSSASLPSPAPLAVFLPKACGRKMRNVSDMLHCSSGLAGWSSLARRSSPAAPRLVELMAVVGGRVGGLDVCVWGVHSPHIFEKEFRVIFTADCCYNHIFGMQRGGWVGGRRRTL